MKANSACPFCGEEPGLARQVRTRFIVGCESDDCHICPQVSGDTLSEVWARWNQRTPSSDLLAALKECAADFISEPCTLAEAHVIAREEFLRRMEIARAAIEKATGRPLS